MTVPRLAVFAAFYGGALLVGACGSNSTDSVVIVHVTAADTVAGIMQLRALFSNGGDHNTRIFPDKTDTQVLAFPKSFSVTLAASRMGALDLAIDGIDVTGKTVASGANRTTLIPGGKAELTVILSNGAATCGNGNPSDPGEQCDDGNRFSGDGCDFMCHLETAVDGGPGDVRDSGVSDVADAPIPSDVATGIDTGADAVEHPPGQDAGDAPARDVPSVPDVGVDIPSVPDVGVDIRLAPDAPNDGPGGAPSCPGGANLVGWWRFEDDLSTNGTTAMDSSGRGNHGALVSGNNASVAGKLGKGFALNSATEIDVPNSPSLNPQSITVMYWVNLSVPSAFQAGIVKRSGSANDGTFQAVINGPNGSNPANQIDFSYFNSFWNERISVAPITTGTWHHLVFTFDGGTKTSALFVDGAGVSSTVPNQGEPLVTTFTSTLKMNYSYLGGARLSGVMDEVRIYDRALGATEIADCFNATTGTSTKCSGVTSDLNSDSNNCGACNYACVNGRTCSSGRCTPAWQPIATAGGPGPRDRHAAAAMAGKFYVTGSCSPGSSTSGSSNSVSAYNPALNTWSAAPSMNAARAGHAAASTGTRIYVFGGITDCAAGNTNGPALESLDPGAAIWTNISTPGQPGLRYNFAMAWTGAELFLYGGGNNSVPFLASGARFNPGTPAWSDAFCALGSCERGNGGLFTHNGITYFLGGNGGNSPAWLQYTLASGAWAPRSVPPGTPNLASPKFGDDGRRLYVLNTVPAGCPATLQVETFDRQTWSWAAPDTSPGPGNLGPYGAAAWVGSELIAWSGPGACGSTVLLDGGGRYQPPAPP